MKSLSTWQVVVLSIGLFIFSSVFTLTDFSIFKVRLSDTAKENLQLITEDKARNVDLFLSNIEHNVALLSAGVDAVFDDVNSIKDAENVRTFEKKHYSILETAMENEPEILTSYVRFNPEYCSPTSGIFITRNENQELENLAPTDLSKYDPSDIEHVGWYYIPVSLQTGCWMDPYNNENIGKYIISYVQPIIKNGYVLGVVGMDVDYSYFTEALSRVKVYKTGYAYLRGKNGLVEFHPKLEFNSIYVKPAEMEEYSLRLKNQMTFTVTAPKSEVYEKRNTIINLMLISHFLIYVIFVGSIVIIVYRINYREVVEKKTFRNEGTSVNIWINFAIVIFAILFGQLIFLFSKSGFFKSEKQVTIFERNDFEQTLNVVAYKDLCPFSYYDETGNPNGYDIEYVRGIGNQLHKNVNIQLMTWADAVETIKSGKADMILGVENTAGPDDAYFSRSSSTSSDYIIVYGKIPIKEMSEIKNDKIGRIRAGTEIDLYSMKSNAVYYDSFSEILDAIEADEIPYGVIKKSVADVLIKNKGYKDIIPVFELKSSRLCIGVNVKDVKLLNQVNSAITNLNNEGVTKKLSEKWLENHGTRITIFDVIREYSTFFIISGIVVIVCFVALFWISLRVYYEEKHRSREDTLVHLSETDILTQLLNRGAGEKKIQELIGYAKKGMFCLLDVDKFKSINDTFGHMTGDKVLTEVARCLSSSFRDRDIIMRLGGDEFAAYAVGVDNEQLGAVVINRFFTALREVYIPEIGDKKINVSLGAVFYDGTEKTSFDELYKKADVLTYKSKAQDGNTMTFN